MQLHTINMRSRSLAVLPFREYAGKMGCMKTLLHALFRCAAPNDSPKSGLLMILRCAAPGKGKMAISLSG